MPSLSRGGKVLSRALYRQKMLSLAAVPMAQRRAVLRSLLIAWSPFAESSYRVALRGDSALAFAWDRAALDDESGATVLPEGLLHEPMGHDGLRIVAGLEGFEAQLWRGAWPMASRWWPQPPGTDDWQSFVRSVPVDLAPGLPATAPPAADAVWCTKPWAAVQSLDQLAHGGSRVERLALATTVVCFVALSAGQARWAWVAYKEREDLMVQRATARAAATPVLAARERALAVRSESDAMGRELTAVQPLEVLAQLAQTLPAHGVLLKELELTGQRLKLGLELSDKVQRSAIVKDLQAGGWFTAVTEQRELPGRTWTAFELNLSSKSPPGQSAMPAGAATPMPAPPVVSKP